MTMAQKHQVRVGFTFPTRGREFNYEYDQDMEQDFLEVAMRQFKDEHADTMFALAGQYVPMDVTVEVDDMVVAVGNLCYAETFWNQYFDEPDDPWHGRFSPFILALSDLRYRKDESLRKQLHQQQLLKAA